jgi:hypothetical protein
MVSTKKPLKAPSLDAFRLDLLGKFNITPTDLSGARLGVIPWMYLLNQEPEEIRNKEGSVHTTIMNFMRDSGWHLRICPEEERLKIDRSQVLKAIDTLAYQRYYREVITPVRRWLEPGWQKRPKQEEDWQGLHLNFVTAEEEQIVKDPRTGRLSIKRVGPRSLCLIPTSVTVLDQLGQPDERRRLAPQALRQIMTKVGYRTIRTSSDMKRNIDGWLEVYGPGAESDLYRVLLFGKVQKDAPCIAESPEIGQLLLPGTEFTRSTTKRIKRG